MSLATETKREVIKMLRQGHKLKAIKYLSDSFKISLQDAKVLVEAAERDIAKDVLPSSPNSFTLEVSEHLGDVKLKVQELLRSGNKLEAVKFVKEQTGAPLKQSLEWVEQVQREIDPNYVKRTGCVASTFKMVGMFFLAGSLILLGVAAITFYTNEQSMDNSVIVTGTVVGLVPNQETQGLDAYAPLITFAWEGEERTYQENIYSAPPAYEIGEQVELIIDTNNPETVYLNNFAGRWLTITILGVTGFILLVIAAVMLAVGKKST